ncbi:glycoside hydrolase family 85 protein [Auriscalpium vulgare]|uniref:Glycoside hydrolase family 85 protein n=1 Tax=Auriscalpium vulgare TaxID=40419 RepID=A0ACB8S9N7_9AGAM|nr:glycoside hydrolase family 85 protein [Auriscalpium vulgare]
MPLSAPASPSGDKFFFSFLEDLDAWANNHTPWTAVAKLCKRPESTTAERKGRLLLCHDFKGGYSEDASTLSYTFNFWPLIDTFVYFSHHRVTVPPPGWTSSAHRQGVKMLGTLIFEHPESEPDCLRLLFGRLPRSKTGPAAIAKTDTSPVPVSPHYARLLAELAYERGFDGYLLNFEFPLRADGGVGHSRALAAWIALLQAALKETVGPHAEVIWYDSVVITGQVRWQDRLNNYNLPFFVPSTGFFTNYTWPATYPMLSAQFFSSLDYELVAPGSSFATQKTLQDIYTGVDMWGRGSHGGGGFGSYKALEHIDPGSLTLSVALFGQGWTWESEQDKPGWNWEAWWRFERNLWLGPALPTDEIVVPPMPRREGDPECPHGPFRPITSFFSPKPPPDPVLLPFYTAFSPGVGFAWFVSGKAVLQPRKEGWTDIDKQGSIGDQLWPRPRLLWEDADSVEHLPSVSSELYFDDAWMGGNCVRVAFSACGSDAEDAFFRCIWLPIQTLGLTPNISYDAEIVFKTASGLGPDVDIDIGLSFKVEDDSEAVLEISSISSSEDLSGEWTRQSLQIKVISDAGFTTTVIGLVVGFATEDPSLDVKFSVLVGQISVASARPSPSPGLLPVYARILWADFQRSAANDSHRLTGLLTWEVAASFPPVAPISTIPAHDDPNPVWRLDTSDHWFPRFLYFNVYAEAHSPNGQVTGPEDATFLGTTGLAGRRFCFDVDAQALPHNIHSAALVRFYIQGVTNRGEVLSWDRCVFVDV